MRRNPIQNQNSNPNSNPNGNPKAHQSNSGAGPRQPDLIDTIPNSNSIDSAMYERDKQIYRCSTLRQGGKFDSNYKPSILNCPLPEIPKEASESPKKEAPKDQGIYSKTLHRPPMKLPPNAKAIPPPKIDTPTSPPKNGTMQPIQKGGVVSPEQKPSSPPSVQSPKTPNNNSTAVTTSDETAINPNDESNYAVTEL